MYVKETEGQFYYKNYPGEIWTPFHQIVIEDQCGNVLATYLARNWESALLDWKWAFESGIALLMVE